MVPPPAGPFAKYIHISSCCDHCPSSGSHRPPHTPTHACVRAHTSCGSLQNNTHPPAWCQELWRIWAFPCLQANKLASACSDAGRRPRFCLHSLSRSSNSDLLIAGAPAVIAEWLKEWVQRKVQGSYLWWYVAMRHRLLAYPCGGEEGKGRRAVKRKTYTATADGVCGDRKVPIHGPVRAYVSICKH